MAAAVRQALCNFRADPAAGAVIAQRSAAALDWLAGLDAAARLALLQDPRPAHLRLFHGLAPAAFPDAAGTYRGTPGSSAETSPRAVFLARRLPGLRARDICLPAADVPAAMQDLSAQLNQIWQARPGAEDPYRDAGFAALAGVTSRFFAIHPFLDGNGHIWRLLLPVLADRLALAARPEWTVDRRPYGPEFSLALQWYGDHPSLLADQLRRWFSPR